MITTIDNEYVAAFVLAIFIVGVVGSFVRILLPNYNIKQYMSKKWSMPNDNHTRFWGIVFLLLNGYVLLYLLGYI